jgi:hypothetical protein
MLRDFATFLVEKYDAIVLMVAAPFSMSWCPRRRYRPPVFLGSSNSRPSATQRHHLPDAWLQPDQIKVVVNRYSKKVTATRPA